MPDLLQTVARFLPLTYLCDALRQVMVGGAAFAPLAVCVAILAGWPVVCFGIRPASSAGNDAVARRGYQRSWWTIASSGRRPPGRSGARERRGIGRIAERHDVLAVVVVRVPEEPRTRSCS